MSRAFLCCARGSRALASDSMSNAQSAVPAGCRDCQSRSVDAIFMFLSGSHELAGRHWMSVEVLGRGTGAEIGLTATRRITFFQAFSLFAIFSYHQSYPKDD